jgi:chromosome segregation ATPase
MSESLDTALKARAQSVLDGEPVTEAALRRLLEEARACILILRARLGRTEARLAELAADPEGSLAETATAFRALVDVRADLEELEAVLAALEDRARAARASWLASTAVP